MVGAETPPSSINFLTSSGETPAPYKKHLTVSVSPARRAFCALVKISLARCSQRTPAIQREHECFCLFRVQSGLDRSDVSRLMLESSLTGWNQIVEHHHANLWRRVAAPLVNVE